MTIHSSILAWRILRTEEPGRLQMHRVAQSRHDWSSLACMLILIPSRENPPKQDKYSKCILEMVTGNGLRVHCFVSLMVFMSQVSMTNFRDNTKTVLTIIEFFLIPKSFYYWPHYGIQPSLTFLWIYRECKGFSRILLDWNLLWSSGVLFKVILDLLSLSVRNTFLWGLPWWSCG